MIEVELPDGRVLEFPDGMSKEQMAAAMKTLPGVGAPQAPQEEDSLFRQLGLTARAGIRGVTALPGMLADVTTRPALNAGLAAFGSDKRFPPQGQAVEQALTAAGVPEPQTGGERVVQDVAGAMTGVGSTAKLAELVAKGGPALKQAIARIFASRQGAQVAAAGTGGAAMGGAREAGAGPGGQMAAAMAGSVLPAAGAAALRVPAGVTHRLVEPYIPKRPVPGALRERLSDPFIPSGIDRIKSRTLADLVGQRKGAVVDALNDPSELVPGSRPTAAEAATSAGSTELAAAQKLLANKFDPSGYADMGAAQEAARLAAVRGVGKTPQALAAAVGRRQGQATQDYAKAFSVQVKADPELAKIASNPYFKETLPEAFKLAKAKGIDPKKDLGHFLHLVKLSLDKSLGKTGDTALSRTEMDAVNSVKGSLVKWLEKANPDYDAARTNFAANSKPINKMQVGQFLEQKLVAPLTEAERPAGFAQAMREAPGAVQRKVGGPRFSDVREVLDPPETQALEGLLADLARKAEFGKQASTGTTAATEKLSAAFRPIEPPGILHRGVMIARAVLERMQGKASKKVLESLTEDLKDPQKIAKLLAQAKTKEAKPFGAEPISAADLQLLAQTLGRQ